jgi:hypothetical protein
MSHLSTAKTELRDEAALRKACAELGCKLVDGEQFRARGYSGQQPASELVIQCPGASYDIAVNKQQDGTYALTTDWFCGSVAAKVGDNFDKLTQCYAGQLIEAEAEERGYFVEREWVKDELKLHITGGQL